MLPKPQSSTVFKHREACTYGTNTPTDSRPYKATVQASLHHSSPKNCPIPGQTVREEVSTHFVLFALVLLTEWLPVKHWSSFGFPAWRADVIEHCAVPVCSSTAENYRASPTLADMDTLPRQQTNNAPFVCRQSVLPLSQNAP